MGMQFFLPAHSFTSQTLRCMTAITLLLQQNVDIMITYNLCLNLSVKLSACLLTPGHMRQISPGVDQAGHQKKMCFATLVVNTKPVFPRELLMPHACQSSEDIWAMLSLICFNLK